MTSRLDPRVHGDAFARDGLLDFAVNVRPGRPATLHAALAAALGDERYPNDLEARAAIAALHGTTAEHVLTLNGACEGFWLVAHALRPRRAVCIHPTFSEGELALLSAGADVERVIVSPPEWRLDPSRVSEAADFVVVTNPNNPTGHLESAETVAGLARAGRTLLVDESFMDFARGRETLSSRLDLPGLVVVRSCTKLWSLAGIRAGYLLAEAKLVATLARRRQPWPVNTLACAALRFAARERDIVEQLVTAVDRDRDHLARSLEAIAGLRVFASVTNFLLVEARCHPNVPDGLRARGIAVRPAASFPGLSNNFFRVAVRGVADHRRLARALVAVIADG